MEDTMTNQSIEVRHAELYQKHAALRDRVTAIEESMNGHLKNIYDKLDQFGGRPSWVVVTIISLLSSGFFALLALHLSKGGN